MEKLPVEIFDLILTNLTLTDWKCLRLTSRTIYDRLSSISTYSHRHSICLTPKSSSGVTILENLQSTIGIDFLNLSNFDSSQLTKLLQTSDIFRTFLHQLKSLSFSGSARLIDSRLFYDLLVQCRNLEKLDLSDYKFFFLSNNFEQTSNTFPSVRRLNLSGNTHLSDYAFNRLVRLFPNLSALHLLGIPLRSSLDETENRTFLTFENVLKYIQTIENRCQALTLSFVPTLNCDAQIKRLFDKIPAKLTFFHIDGSLTLAALNHLLLLVENRLETLIVGRIILDHTGCVPLFAAINEFASNLKQLCIFLNSSIQPYVSQQQKSFFPVITPTSDISLSLVTNLNDLDIQTLYPLNEVDLIQLLTVGDCLKHLKKLALPKNTTDDVMKNLCVRSSFARSLTHLNISSCPSLSNRSILLINQHLHSLEEFNVNSNVNINDFAFIGLSICGIGKSIEWINPTLINRQFIDDLPIWTHTITHQLPCLCQLPVFISSSCIKLRLKDFNFDYDENSDRILSNLTEYKLFTEYFHSINELKHLKTLKLRQCVQLTNRLFRFAFRFLPNLKNLDLSGCDKLTDKHLSLIGQTCPSIETIDLTGCHRITDMGRQNLKEKAKRLQILDF